MDNIHIFDNISEPGTGKDDGLLQIPDQDFSGS